MSSSLLPSETELVGSWIFDGKYVQADLNEQRIEWLMANSLKEIARDPSGWELLFRDPQDGRFWELTRLHGELQSGGPLKLSCINELEARTKYGLPIDRI